MTQDPAEVRMHIGMRGSGKSYYTDRYIKRLRDSAVPTVVLDMYGEHVGEIGTREARSWQQVAAHPQILMQDALSLSVVVPSESKEELGHALQVLVFLIRARWARMKKLPVERRVPMVLIVEEVSLIRYRQAELLEEIATQSRHWGCACVLIAQWATLIPIGLRRQSTVFVSFHQEDDGDIEAVRDRIRDDLAYELPTLRVGEYVEWRQYRGARIHRREDLPPPRRQHTDEGERDAG